MPQSRKSDLLTPYGIWPYYWPMGRIAHFHKVHWSVWKVMIRQRLSRLFLGPPEWRADKRPMTVRQQSNGAAFIGLLIFLLSIFTVFYPDRVENSAWRSLVPMAHVMFTTAPLLVVVEICRMMKRRIDVVRKGSCL